MDESDVRQMWWVTSQEKQGSKNVSRFKVVVFDGTTRLNKFIEAEPCFVEEVSSKDKGAESI